MKHIKHISLFLLLGLLLSLNMKGYEGFYSMHSGQQNTTPKFLKQGDTWATQQLAQLSLEEKIAQFFMVASWSNRGEAHQLEIERLVREQKIGGIIYFQGDRKDLKKSITRMQAAAKVPLLIGMDAEWGIGMRLNDEERFPYAYTIGAANKPKLSRKIGEMIAQECQELGIHINFAPVADLNSNPDNPVIGFRAFAQDAKQCGQHVRAVVEGMEQQGVLSSIKHFPGHGDTKKDSHYELPLLEHDKAAFLNTHLQPFVAGIQAGASTVMMGHLSVPALDSTGTPASLSKPIIQGILRDALHFKGLVVSDALNMKAVADRYGKTEVVVKAYEAGNDILLFPEDVALSIKRIAEKIQLGELSLDELNQRCKRLLLAKYHVLNPAPKKDPSYNEFDMEWAKRDVYERALTVLKNDSIFPLVKQHLTTAIVQIGVHTDAFWKMSQRFNDCDRYTFYSFEEAALRLKDKLDGYDQIITTIHPKSVRAQANFSLPGEKDVWLNVIPSKIAHGMVLFGNPSALKNLTNDATTKGIILAYENHPYAQEAAAQLVFGAIGSQGHVPFSIAPLADNNAGLEVKAAQRLKFTMPEELGVSRADLAEIDRLATEGIEAGAFPGCQILVAVHGKVIYQKSFGTITYSDSIPVRNDHVYDIASISKIAGSTACLMRLQTLNKFDLDKELKDYIPDLVGSSDKADIRLRNMMAHQAGLRSWIPFYVETVDNGVLNKEIYSSTQKKGFEVPVAENLWIRNDFEKEMFGRILASDLKKRPRYEYSDLGYYFTRKIIEQQSSCRQDLYLNEEFYNPMGLKNIRYLPQLYFPMERIVPTEEDKTFRGQHIHGYVHDPGAAMLGGIGGHAGLFSNAQDLAAMMQLYLNQGVYGNRLYIKPEVINEYTHQQLAGNRRGAGFDRPTGSRRSPCCSSASMDSYGHSGFTGTFTWADPKYGINYVFLSNRVSPDASNQKINQIGTRLAIQEAIYKAVKQAQIKP